MLSGLKASLVIVISLMAVTSALVIPTGTKAADTSDAPVTEISGAPGDASFYDVAWSPDGKFALWVGADGGTGRGCIYRYDPSASGAGAWQMLFVFGADPSAGLIRAIAYVPWEGVFVALAFGDPSGFWYEVNSDGSNIWEFSDATLVNNYIYDVVLDNANGRLLAVGQDMNPAYGGVCYQLWSGSSDWTILFYDGNPNAALVGVAWDPYYGYIYAVGYDSDVGCGLYYRYTGTLDWAGMGSYPSEYMDMMFSDIVYSPTASSMVLCLSQRTSGIAGIYYGISPGYENLQPVGSESDWSNIYMQMDIDSSGTIIAVGYLDGVDYGRIHRIWRDAFTNGWHVSQASTDGASMMGYNFLSVAIRPARIPMALIAGSAFVYHYTSANSGVQVNAAYPHINYVDIFAAGTSTSYVNSPVDVDDGSNTIGYDVTVSVYHSAGQGYITNAEVSLFRDGGTNESMPWWGAGGYAAVDYGNMRARYVWNRGSPDTWSVICPTITGSEEITLVPSECSRVDEPDGQNVTIKFRVYFHQQARAALGPFTEGAGVRNANQHLMSAYNDFDSWNIWFSVVDTGGGIDYAYDEFGIYQYTYIGSSGLPGGGAVSGSGAPGLTVMLSPTSDVTYSANCPYRLSASITDLTGDNLFGTIPATSFQTQGGNLPASWMPGADMPMYYYGSAVPAYQNPLDAGRTTTSSTGDFNPDADPIIWWCVIPPALEDRYRGTITYAISHG
ncbi:MAG: hypothetical protein V1934_03870 [Methanobacteriota archaeon]